MDRRLIATITGNFATMVVFPHAKINLGLNVISRREDGYHDIETIMVPIPLHDMLEVVVAKDGTLGEVEYSRTGLSIPGSTHDDLCLKAIELVKRRRELPALKVHLHKVIPMGAGAGGGSSDGAHMLMLLNDLLSLGLEDELHTMAAELGSDAPFFLHHGAQLAEGRGGVLSPVAVDLEGIWLHLVNPGIHVSTAEVYRNMVPSGRSDDLAGKIGAPIHSWQATIHNRMETYVMEKHPSVLHVKETLLRNGAIYAAMSGSGSSVYGLFNDRPTVPAWPPDHRSWTFRLR